MLLRSLVLGSALLMATGCDLFSRDAYVENCFATAHAKAGGEGGGGTDDGGAPGSGASEASGQSGCSKTPTD